MTESCTETYLDNYQNTHFSVYHFEEIRRKAQLPLPLCLQKNFIISEENTPSSKLSVDTLNKLSKFFPYTINQKLVKFIENNQVSCETTTNQPLRVGIVLSGGQAPGGHNVIAGVYDFIKKCHKNSQLFGYLNGPAGIFKHQYKEINDSLMDQYRNSGGFHMLKSGRDKIETPEQLKSSLESTHKLDLHGLVIVGGDDSNTNAAILAEYFKAHNSSTCVIGIPKTIDGDLRNEFVEMSFGFDTAVRTYSEFIGNLAIDNATSQKYYHFVRLMGRSASHITLRCALNVRVNYAIIAEEVQEKNMKLSEIVDDIVAMILKRQETGRNYGIILVPEGLLEFISEIRVLIREIDTLLVKGTLCEDDLSPNSLDIYKSFPESIRNQLIQKRDPHGNVQLSIIETETLLINMIQKKLCSLGCGQNFIPKGHFFGYEGRCAFPSIFDCTYCYALGHVAGALVKNQKTGYIGFIKNLVEPLEKWEAGGYPLTAMIDLEQRKGKLVPVIKKYLVDTNVPPFTLFAQVREHWKLEDFYASPGPIQFNVDTELPIYSLTIPKMYNLLPDKDFGFEQRKTRHWFPKCISHLSPLQIERLYAPIAAPPVLLSNCIYTKSQGKYTFEDNQLESSISFSFPYLCKQTKHELYSLSVQERSHSYDRANKALRIGVLLSGRQVSGVSNILIGLWDRANLEIPFDRIIGFVGGVSGLLSFPPNYLEFTREDLSLTRNQGGFELLGRGHAPELALCMKENMEKIKQACIELQLDGLVCIGGKNTLTSVAAIAEYFLQNNLKTCVIGIPACQSNDINAAVVESAIGFDTTCKVYSQMIGNLNKDAASNAKYWLFIRLMGSSRSQIAIEAALTTHPNLTLCSEAYTAADSTLENIVSDIADCVITRAETGRNYGTVLMPEGLIALLPQIQQLLAEIHSVYQSNLSQFTSDDIYRMLFELDFSKIELSTYNQAFLASLPDFVRKELVLQRNLEGFRLSQIKTEVMIAKMVETELKRREKKKLCPKINFSPLCFYFGYQGRSSLPSMFDCSLGYSHGASAVSAINGNLTGYVTVIRQLARPIKKWTPLLYPVTAFLRLQGIYDYDMYPSKIPVVPSDTLNLYSRVYNAIVKLAENSSHNDDYVSPGPIQYDKNIHPILTQSLIIEHYKYLKMLERVNKNLDLVRQLCIMGDAKHSSLVVAVSILASIKNIFEKYETDP